jgi:hypothetical protein
VAGPTTVGRGTKWWPEVRRIDVVGLVLFVVIIAWVWWVSRQTGGSGGPVIALLLAVLFLAALARWATYLHGTAPPAAIALVLLGYGLLAGDGADGLGPERLAALLTVGAGAAAVVTVRAGDMWLKAAGGAATLATAYLTLGTGSLTGTLIVAVIVLSTLALLALPMQERRWVVVWPALVAVLVLLGTATYASLSLPTDIALGGLDPERIDAWRLALDTVSEEPLTGIGLGISPPGASTDAVGGWARHDPLQFTAETGVIGGVLLLALLWWALAWVARPGGGPGSVIAGVVIAGSVTHACLEPIWHAPAIPLSLAALAGTASLRGGDARWRLEELLRGVTSDGDGEDLRHGRRADEGEREPNAPQ